MSDLDAEIRTLETQLGILRAERQRLAQPLTVAEVLAAATEPLTTRAVMRRCGRDDLANVRRELAAVGRRIGRGSATCWTAIRVLRVLA
jgi:hypothetical protein